MSSTFLGYVAGPCPLLNCVDLVVYVFPVKILNVILIHQRFKTEALHVSPTHISVILTIIHLSIDFSAFIAAVIAQRDWCCQILWYHYVLYVYL